MRYFALLNFQHVVLFVFPTLVFIVLLAAALGFTHFTGRNSQTRKTRVVHQYPEEIQGLDAPFPLCMTLIIAGTVLWAFFYILLTGVLEVKI